MSDPTPWQPVGFRFRLTLALVGVLALVVPQVVLTVNAMIRLYEGGGEVARLGDLGARAEALAATADLLLATTEREPPHPLAAATDRLSHAVKTELASSPIPDGPARIAAGLDRWRQALAVLPAAATVDADAPHPWLVAVSERREEDVAAITAWHRQHDALADPASAATHIAWLDDRLAASPERVLFAALPLEVADHAMVGAWTAARRHRIAAAAAEVRADFSALRTAIHATMSHEADTIKARVDAANRYLVTLVLLTLVYVAALIVILPGRLVGPLRHLRAVMERAAAGHVDIEARALGKDEMGQLGRALNMLLRRVRTFDTLKRDRIVQDRGHIRRLLDLVPTPYAILDPHHRIEHANGPFRELFALPDDCEDRVLTDALGGDDLDAFANLLDDALTRRRAVDRLALTLRGPSGPRDYLLTLEPARNRAGRVAALRVRLDPRPPAA